jgi:hypothetical protein
MEKNIKTRKNNEHVATYKTQDYFIKTYKRRAIVFRSMSMSIWKPEYITEVQIKINSETAIFSEVIYQARRI